MKVSKLQRQSSFHGIQSSSASSSVVEASQAPSWAQPPVINRIRRAVYDAVDALLYERNPERKMLAFQNLNARDRGKFQRILRKLEQDDYAIPDRNLFNGSWERTSPYSQKGRPLPL